MRICVTFSSKRIVNTFFFLSCFRHTEYCKQDTHQADYGDEKENDDKPKVKNCDVEQLELEEANYPVPCVADSSNCFL